MRTLLLPAALLLSSCAGLFGGGDNIQIPVSEAQKVAGWASQIGGFDANKDGVLDNAEAAAFLSWFGFQVLTSYVVQGPTGPQGPVTQPVTQPGT